MRESQCKVRLDVHKELKMIIRLAQRTSLMTLTLRLTQDRVQDSVKSRNIGAIPRLPCMVPGSDHGTHRLSEPCCSWLISWRSQCRLYVWSWKYGRVWISFIVLIKEDMHAAMLAHNNEDQHIRKPLSIPCSTSKKETPQDKPTRCLEMAKLSPSFVR